MAPDSLSTRLGNFARNSRLDFAIFAGGTLALWLIFMLVTGHRLMEHDGFDQHTRQALAWQHGQNSLPSDDKGIELSYYNNKIYNSFPPTPTLIEFPLTLIFKDNTPNSLVLVIFTWVALLLTYRILEQLTGNRILSYFLSLSLFWGTQILYLSVSGAVWNQGQLYAIFFCILATYLVLNARNNVWYAISGLMLSLAVGCRPLMVFFFPVLAVLACRDGFRLKPLLWLAGGAIPYGIFLGVYNYIRFGSVLEFGHNYLEHVVNVVKHQFGTEFFLRNADRAFINMPVWDEKYQIISFSGAGTAFWLVAPISILGFLGVVGKRLSAVFRAIIFGSMMVMWFILLFHESNGWYQFGYRYLVDLTPFFIILMAYKWQKLSLWMIPIAIFGLVINFYGLLWFHVIRHSLF